MFAASKSGSVEDKDAQFNYVTMLLHGDGTNGSQNKTFLDVGAVFTASVTLTTMTVSAITSGTILIGHTISGSGVSSATISAQLTGTTGGTGTYTVSVSQTVTSGTISSSFAITRNGNTTQGTFTPYGDNWSNYMTSGYLTTASNADFALSADFTVQCWVFSGDSSLDGSTRRRIFHTGGGDVAASLQLLLGTSAGNSAVISVLNSGFLIDGTISVVTSSWNHVAVTRSGTSLKLFVNGVQSGSTATTSQNFNSGTSNTVYIGANSSGGGIWQGYISNLSVVNGTALYTSAFTPSTTPLSTGTTNQKLLVCQVNRFIDSNTATTAKTITVNSTPSVQRFSPFSPTTAYSTSVIGGSAYLDGTGDYLTLPVSSAFDLGTNACCVEAWVYLTNNNIFGIFTSSNSTSGQTRPNFYARYDQLQLDYFGTVVIQANITVTLNCWHHVVFTRASSSGAWRIFLDGVLQAYNATGSQNLLQTGAAQEVGRTYAGTTGQGYMGDVRIVNGAVPSAYVTSSTTVGATIFTPPTAPLTAITNTSLLLSYTNAAIIDNAMMNDLETVGNAQISTSVKKYGTGSIVFDGSGDLLTIPNNTSWQSSVANSQGFNFGTGDFTVECWVYFNATTSFITIVGSRNYSNGGSSTYGNWVLRAGTSNLYTSYSNSSTSKTISGTYSWSTGVWYHVAWVRYNGTVSVYRDGTSIGSVADSTSLTDGQYGITVGGNFDTAGTQGTIYNPLNGYIDDLRISKVARYTANFTAPTAAFADKG